MRRVQLKVAGVLAAGSLLLAVPDVRADTPTPTPGDPSCAGTILATFNHRSGVVGPSGNPLASSGPGASLGPETPVAIFGIRGAFCATQ
jgi:hypothetical protein